MPHAAFYRFPSIAKCKQCHRAYMRERARQHVGPAEGGACLYLAVNPKIPGEVKIGKSHDPVKRLQQLERGQNFRLQIVATFPGVGHLESAVHESLSRRRVDDGSGREWFRVSTELAIAAVLVVRERESAAQ